jgi:hypothetical protein
MDPDSDPSIFIIDLHDANKKLIKKKNFQQKVKKKSQNSRNQGFSYYFCLLKKDPDQDPYF